MSAEQSLYDGLRLNAPVVAVVGTRIFLDIIPQDKALPAIAFVRAGTEFVNTIHGGIGRTKATVEVWSVAATRTAAEALATLAMQTLITSRFFPIDRRPESDPESETFSTVLTYSIWE